MKKNTTLRSAEEFAEETYYHLDEHDEGGYIGIDTREYARLLNEFKDEHTAALQAELKECNERFEAYQLADKIIYNDLKEKVAQLQAENKRLRDSVKDAIVIAWKDGHDEGAFATSSYYNGIDYFNRSEECKQFRTTNQQEGEG